MERTKDCLYCSIKFSYVRSSRIYCGQVCKQKHQADKRRATTKNLSRERRIKRKESKLIQSPYGLWLVKTIKHCGTVQVLQGSSTFDLEELFSINKARSTFSGFKDGVPTAEYHLSHIYSAKEDKESIGLLRASNLVICPAKFNQSRKKSEEAVSGRGNYIKRAELLNKYKCGLNTTTKQVISMIRELLGNEFDEFLLNNDFPPGMRQQLARQVSKHTKVDPSMSVDDLKQMAVKLGLEVYNPPGKPAPLVVVLAHEMERFSLNSDPLYWVIRQKVQPLRGGKHQAELRDVDECDYFSFIYNSSLNLLHQQPVHRSYLGKDILDYYVLPHFARFKLDQHSALSPIDYLCTIEERYIEARYIFNEGSFERIQSSGRSIIYSSPGPHRKYSLSAPILKSEDRHHRRLRPAFTFARSMNETKLVRHF